MKVYVDAWGTEVTPNDQDVETECRPGSGADTCVYLVVSNLGFQCKYNQYQFTFALEERLKTSISQRKGCQRVIDWHKQEGNISMENLHQTLDIP